MSESNRNPDEEIEVKGVELPEGWTDADFEDEPQVATQAENLVEPVTPTPETPSEEPPAPRVPPIFEGIESPEDRKKLIEDALAGMTPEERASLRGMDDIVRTVREFGQTEGAQSAHEQLNRRANETQLEQAAETFIDRAKQYGSDPAFQWDKEIANVEKHAGDLRQNDFVSKMTRGIGSGFGAFGIRSFPSDVIARVNAAQDFDQVIAEYVQYAVMVGAEGGKRQQSDVQAAQQEADAIALRSRAKNEALGELAKGGRIRINRDAEGLFAELLSDTPPVLNGDVPAGAAVVDEAEYALALEDPDAWDRMMANPGKAAFIHKLQAEAVGARSR